MMLFSLCAFAVIHHGDVQVWLFYERNMRARKTMRFSEKGSARQRANGWQHHTVPVL
jgi:hypothetical protein